MDIAVPQPGPGTGHEYGGGARGRAGSVVPLQILTERGDRAGMHW